MQMGTTAINWQWNELWVTDRHMRVICKLKKYENRGELSLLSIVVEDAPSVHDEIGDEQRQHYEERRHPKGEQPSRMDVFKARSPRLVVIQSSDRLLPAVLCSAFFLCSRWAVGGALIPPYQNGSDDHGRKNPKRAQQYSPIQPVMRGGGVNGHHWLPRLLRRSCWEMHSGLFLTALMQTDSWILFLFRCFFSSP